MLCRLAAFFTPRFMQHGQTASNTEAPALDQAHMEYNKLASELLKATGAQRKTMGDHLSDAAEALHLKSKSEEQAAAERIAHEGHLPTLDKESAQQLANDMLGHGVGSSGGTVDSILKALHIRPRTEVEQAARAYEHALEEMKQALTQAHADSGEPEPTGFTHRVTRVFSDAGSSVKETTSTTYNWLTHRGKNAAGDAAEAAQEAAQSTAEKVQDSVQNTWNDASGRTAEAMMRARDTAAANADSMLVRLHLKEPQKTRIQAARHQLDAATQGVMESLGFHQPTTWERMRGRAYDILPGHREEAPRGLLGGVQDAVDGVRDRAASVSDTVSDTYDATLKRLGLRERTVAERALASYHSSWDTIRSKISTSEPSAAQKMAPWMEEQRNRLNEALQSAYEAVPPRGLSSSTGSGSSESEGGVLDSLGLGRAQTTLRHALDRAHEDTDHALKELGLKDRGLYENMRDNATMAYHVLRVQLGLEEPTAMERMKATLGLGGPAARQPLVKNMPHMPHVATPPDLSSSPRSSSSFPTLDRTLKSLGLREKSSVDKAREGYEAALHKVKVALGAEDPTLTEKARAALTDAKDQLYKASHTITGILPKGGLLYPAEPAGPLDTAMEAARGTYEGASSTAIRSLLTAQHAVDEVLKNAGVRDRTGLERARHDLTSAGHDLWVAMGWESPTLGERLSQTWHKTKVAVGADKPTMAESVKANIDALGDATLGGEQEGLLARMKHKIVGA